MMYPDNTGFSTKYTTVQLVDSDGYYHSLNSPAVVFVDGVEYWFKHGLYHRENGPAKDYSKLKRNGGPA